MAENPPGPQAGQHYLRQNRQQSRMDAPAQRPSWQRPGVERLALGAKWAKWAKSASFRVENTERMTFFVFSPLRKVCHFAHFARSLSPMEVTNGTEVDEQTVGRNGSESGIKLLSKQGRDASESPWGRRLISSQYHASGITPDQFTQLVLYKPQHDWWPNPSLFKITSVEEVLLDGQPAKRVG